MLQDSTQRVPGPMGSSPAPGNPPTPTNPQPTPPGGGGGGGDQSGLMSYLLQQMLGGIDTSTNLQNMGLAGQTALGAANEQVGQQQLGQTLQNTLAQLGLSGQQLGIERTGLGEQGAYQQGQYGIQQQSLAEQLANLTAGYGFQQQEQGLQRKQAQQQYQNAMTNAADDLSARGVLTAAGARQAAYTPIQQQYQNTLAQLGLTGREQAQQYGYGKQQLGLQGKGEALTNTYQQQQLQNALANLGISGQQLGLQGTEAQQQYSTGMQNLANQQANTVYQDQLGQMANQQGGYNQAQNLIMNLLQSGISFS